MIWIIYAIVGGLMSLFVFESGIGFDAEAAADALASHEEMEIVESHRLLFRWCIVLMIAATWPVFVVAMLLPGDDL